MKKMKKEEDTKKTLKWRLAELPTAGEVAELVDSEVLTKEEAREILFTESSSSDEKVKALEEQVEFLQDLVSRLASRGNTTFVPYTRTITTPAVYWSSTSRVLNDSGLTLTTGSSNGSGTYTMSVGSGDIS